MSVTQRHKQVKKVSSCAFDPSFHPTDHASYFAEAPFKRCKHKEQLEHGIMCGNLNIARTIGQRDVRKREQQ